MIRLGLCCIFRDQPIKFVTTTATAIAKMKRPDALAKLVEASARELEYQAEVAEWVGADVINIHGGGAYGNKQQALTDFARNLQLLSMRTVCFANRRRSSL